MVYSPKGIADIFRTYYQELYAVQQQEARPGEKNRKITNFLRNVGLPRITKETGEAMEAPISEEELGKALSETAPGKSPGPDGFTIAYYKKIKNILIPKLCRYLNGLGIEHNFSKEALSAAITVILKEGKEGSCALAKDQSHYSTLT